LANDALLEIKDLQTHFLLYEGVVRAVDGVSFDIPEGRSLGVIGESGCGKSVTAQSIMRIVPSPPGKEVGGQILLHLRDKGENEEIVDVLKLPANGPGMRSIRGKQISMVFQEPMTSFSPLHTIGFQIMEAIQVHERSVTKREARDRTISMLGRVGFPRPSRLVDAYPHELSGGMRQRAMIAMALIGRPHLLIADEPTTALDVTMEVQILDLIKDLQAEFGMSLMYISHDLAVVGEMADEVLVMYLGQVMEQASTADILSNPLHPYTKALWRSIPTFEAKGKRLTPVKGGLPNPYALRPGCRFCSRCEHAIPGVCNASVPPLIAVSPGHKARCFLYDPNVVERR